MKKVIAILVAMIVLVGAVFAADGDNILLKSKVAPIAPEFKIYSKDATVGPIVAADAIATNKDISEDEIDWYFTIRQGGSLKGGTTEVDYSRFQGTIKLTVTVKPFENTDLGAVQNVALVSIVQGEGKTAAGAGVGTGNTARLGVALTSVAATENDNYPIATFTLTYAGKKVTDTEADVIATVYAHWDPQEDLPMEDEGSWYTADIILGYEAQ